MLNSLIPKFGSDILKEVAKEMNIPIEDVQKTFDIWLKYLHYLDKETEETAIYIKNIGAFHFSLQKTDKRQGRTIDPKYIAKKRLHILSIFPKLYKCRHDHKTRFFSHVFRVGKENRITPEEIIEKQNRYFFKNDKDYRENYTFEQVFGDTESQVKEQRKVCERKPLVQRETESVSKMPTELTQCTKR